MNRKTRRTEVRKGAATSTRVTLLEDDVDEFEETLAQVLGRLDKIFMALMGLLISVTGGALLLAANLWLGKG